MSNKGLSSAKSDQAQNGSKVESIRCPVGHTGQSVFRNIFGPAQPCELYAGGQIDDQTNKRLLRLAKSMARPLDAVTGRDGEARLSSMPAGYTYLAQLAAHDLVHNPNRFPDLLDGHSPKTDLRTDRLMLETLFGGGPGICPRIFHRTTDRNGQKGGRLRLMFIGDELHHETQRSGMPSSIGSYRDLPRVDVDDGPASGKGFNSYGDALLADQRNDDHLIIAQLTTLFALLHNAATDWLMGKTDGTTRVTSGAVFPTASKMTTLVYRRILFEDLLPQMLDERVREFYEKEGPIEPIDDQRMSREFANAVFRAGHALVRPSYKLSELRINEERETAGLLEILKRTSARSPKGNLPHRGEWLINWSDFFPIDDRRPPQMAVKITPDVESTFVENKLFNAGADGEGGGLMYMDLARGAFSKTRSVQSLVDILVCFKVPGSECLKPEIWREPMMKWLDARVGNEPGKALESVDIIPLLDDPPLLFFTMMEPEFSGTNRVFGPLGSTIIAETFYAARKRTSELIEGDAELAGKAEAFFGEACKQRFDTPSSMPALIRFLAKYYGYEGPEKRFL